MYAAAEYGSGDGMIDIKKYVYMYVCIHLYMYAAAALLGGSGGMTDIDKDVIVYISMYVFIYLWMLLRLFSAVAV